MSIKHEEMVPTADMVWASLKRDQVELEAENSTLTVAFLNDFKVMTNSAKSSFEKLRKCLLTLRNFFLSW